VSRDIAIAIATGASLGLVASAHCVLMCGPLAMTAHARGGNGGSARYLAGRLVSYTLLGALAGSAGKVASALPFGPWVEAVFSWSLALMLLLAAYKLVRERQKPPLLTLGTKPRTSFLGRSLARVAHEPLLLGAATALLPCGALFGGLAAAAALGTAQAGALSMALFATVSGLSLVSVGQLARVVSLGPRGRRGLAVLLVAGAAIMVMRPLPALRADSKAPACPLHDGAL
jgi:sulfite exporter TauE/SafE